ncbi:MAG TPA: PhoH family protein [Anaerovoracaceae bacterium]|nr:PhoH family protein [Anaerovoracaceae bacterium]
MSELRMIPVQSVAPNEVFGILDVNLKSIETDCDVEIVLRGEEILIRGEECERAGEIINELFTVIDSGQILDEQKVSYIMALSREGISYTQTTLAEDVICFTHRGKPLKAKTLGQKRYVQAVKKNDIVFGIGPAGTGKTYIAVAMAIQSLKNKEVEKIILARPAVEAGERLGFLPGDLQEKVDPYLRPLYDALYDILGRDSALRLKEKETIEVVPLAYMRGRTLDNAFIILDEAQNTTKEQMKMFLTRIAEGSRAIITGDITQIDLPNKKQSGLIHAVNMLAHIKEIGFSFFSSEDVMRNPLIKKIIDAYEKEK